MAKKKNLLIVSSRFPFPLEKGDKLRMYNQIKDLSVDYNLHLFSISEYNVSKADREELLKYVDHLYIHNLSLFDKLLQLFKGLWSKKPLQVHYFYNRPGQKKLDQLINDWNIDAIYCQLIRMSEYVNKYPHFKVLDYMDAFSLGLQRRSETANWIQKPILNLEKNRVEAYQNTQTKCFDKLFIIAEKDQQSIQSQQSIGLLRNGVDFDYFKPNTCPKTHRLVFVGNMQYHPNVLAAQFLVNKILPKCLAKGLDINILIAGANPTKEIKQLASERVTVTGWMDDIREAYWSSDIFVAPLFTGSGLQNKVLEAMACKIPVITTPIVNNSLGAQPNETISIANSAESFVDEIHQIMNVMSVSEQENRVEEAYRFVQASYGWSQNNKVLIEAFKA